MFGWQMVVTGSRVLPAVLAGLASLTCSAQETLISASRATEIAREWVGDPQAEVVGPMRAAPEHCHLARSLSAWSVELRTTDGRQHAVQVDALTGVVLSWARLADPSTAVGADTRPRVSLDQSRALAEAFAAEKHPAFSSGRWVLALGSPLKGAASYQWAWEEVIDANSGALGPSELFVEVSDQAPEVISFWRPPQAPVAISTHPSIGRGQILNIARRYAILDPARYPVNRVNLRVQMDDYGAQRLVWECLQVLGHSADTGVLRYGVVFDAHTGEPLYPIAPVGGGKYPVRQISLPHRISVRIEPGGRAMTTNVAQPVLLRGELHIRAEHLRAVDGVGVDVDRAGVTVRAGDRVVNGKELGARYQDYGWWVPLRRAATVLGWRVEWNSAKKEAVLHVR